MSTHVIVGAGAIGTELALLLAEAGHDVVVASRRGRAPRHPRIRAAIVDASSPAELERVVAGADVLYNCANPPSYDQWIREWPPLPASLLATARSTGATLVTLSNLYGYGPVDVPMTTDLPLAATFSKGALRADMWRAALSAHEAGEARVAEVRASDYVGPTLGPDHGLLPRYLAAVLAGRTASVMGDPDAPHSWSYAPDVAAVLAAVGTTPDSWGRAWHVPSADPRSVREVLQDFSGARVRLRRTPSWLVGVLGLAVPLLREVREVLYQFERPYVIDASETTAELGVAATPWPEVVSAVRNAWKQPPAVV